MVAFEVPRQLWTPMLDALVRRAEGSAVRLEIETAEVGDQEIGALLPLRGIDVETKGSDRGGLWITVGRDREELRHLIQDPVRLFLGQGGSGEIAWIAIEDGHGGKTFVHFKELLRLEPGLLASAHPTPHQPAP